VFHISIGGLGVMLGATKPTKVPPVATGLLLGQERSPRHNCPCKMQASGFGLPPTADTKITLKKTITESQHLNI